MSFKSKICNSCRKKVNIDTNECPYCHSHVFIENKEIKYPELIGNNIFQSKICNSCGKKVNIDTNECPYCHSHVFIENKEIKYPESNSIISNNIGLQCPQCNFIIPQGDNFCQNCGYQIQKQQKQMKPNFYPKCGTKIEGKYKFCINCGTPIQ